MAPSQAIVRPISRWMTASLLAGVLLLSPAGAVEPDRVSIQTLLSPQATSYQQHLVTLEGVTSDLQVLPPTAGRKCPTIYGRATFLLDDETGSVPVEVLGNCKPSAAEALPKDGDRVRITGIVQVLKSEAPRDVRVSTTVIQIIESN